MANNTQKSIIDAKISFRATLIKALEDAGIGPVEIVGDCDVAFYMNVGEKKQVFTLKGSFKKNNTKLSGPRDPEDVMCDLIDGYAEKQEGRRCAAALREKEKKEKEK